MIGRSRRKGAGRRARRRRRAYAPSGATSFGASQPAARTVVPVCDLTRVGRRADLVGFTSRAERLDPEEVRALQAPYWARVRSELERPGGTVEKFIADAVMALFGAPQGARGRPRARRPRRSPSRWRRRWRVGAR